MTIINLLKTPMGTVGNKQGQTLITRKRRRDKWHPRNQEQPALDAPGSLGRPAGCGSVSFQTETQAVATQDETLGSGRTAQQV